MSILPVGRRAEMVGQMFKLANDMISQPSAAGQSPMSNDLQDASIAPANDEAALPSSEMGNAADDSASFHDFVYKQLQSSLGVDPQIISRKSSSLIKFEEDIDSGKMSGHFLVPVELPSGERVSHEKAKEIAAAVFSQFGLKGKIGRDEKRNFYVISFVTKEAEVPKSSNEGSFSNLPDNEVEKKITTASVQNDMISMRKNMLVDALRRNGYIK